MCSLWNKGLAYSGLQRPPPDSVQRQMNPSYFHSPIVLLVHFNFILRQSLSFTFPDAFFTHFLSHDFYMLYPFPLFEHFNTLHFMKNMDYEAAHAIVYILFSHSLSSVRYSMQHLLCFLGVGLKVLCTYKMS